MTERQQIMPFQHADEIRQALFGQRHRHLAETAQLAERVVEPRQGFHKSAVPDRHRNIALKSLTIVATPCGIQLSPAGRRQLPGGRWPHGPVGYVLYAPTRRPAVRDTCTPRTSTARPTCCRTCIGTSMPNPKAYRPR